MSPALEPHQVPRTASVDAARRSLLALVPRVPREVSHSDLMARSLLTPVWTETFIAEGLASGSLGMRTQGKARFYSRIGMKPQPGDTTPDLPFGKLEGAQ